MTSTKRPSVKPVNPAEQSRQMRLSAGLLVKTSIKAGPDPPRTGFQ
jgi:hypothetical protein